MRTTLLTLLLLPAAVSGCAARGNVELLEARLRSRESELFQVRQELDRARNDLTASRRENGLLQQSLAEHNGSAVYPETARRLAQITGIRFDTRLTGALDRDGAPGDDELNVVIAPHDAGNEVVKQEGTLEVELIDLSQPDNHRVVGSWRMEPDNVAQHWHDGLLGKGIQMTVPWQAAPQSESLTLFARFITPDGRRFETTHALNVELGTTASRALPAPAAAAKPQPKVLPTDYQPSRASSNESQAVLPLEAVRSGPVISPQTR